MRSSVLLRWLPPALWAGVIFVFSAQPGSAVPGRFATLAHLVVYAILGALLVAALLPGRDSGAAVAIAVLLASLYGVTDEFHQAFVPLRTPDVADWGVDTVGALVGALVVVALTNRARPSRGSKGGS